MEILFSSKSIKTILLLIYFCSWELLYLHMDVGYPQTNLLQKMEQGLSFQEGIWKKVELQLPTLTGKKKSRVPSSCKATILKRRFSKEQDSGDI